MTMKKAKPTRTMKKKITTMVMMTASTTANNDNDSNNKATAVTIAILLRLVPLRSLKTRRVEQLLETKMSLLHTFRLSNLDKSAKSSTLDIPSSCGTARSSRKLHPSPHQKLSWDSSTIREVTCGALLALPCCWQVELRTREMLSVTTSSLSHLHSLSIFHHQKLKSATTSPTKTR